MYACTKEVRGALMPLALKRDRMSELDSYQIGHTKTHPVVQLVCACRHSTVSHEAKAIKPRIIP